MQAPSRRTSASSRSYSLGVSATGAPSRRTVREGVSTSISPNFSNGGDGAPPFLRGSAARRRAAPLEGARRRRPVRARVGAPPQQRLEPREQLEHAERLGHVVVGAEPQAAD